LLGIIKGNKFQNNQSSYKVHKHFRRCYCLHQPDCLRRDSLFTDTPRTFIMFLYNSKSRAPFCRTSCTVPSKDEISDDFFTRKNFLRYYRQLVGLFILMLKVGGNAAVIYPFQGTIYLFLKRYFNKDSGSHKHRFQSQCIQYQYLKYYLLMYYILLTLQRTPITICNACFNIKGLCISPQNIWMCFIRINSDYIPKRH
jgi:hypothetical protein